MDYEYFCKNLAHLMGLPVRVYQRGALLHSSSNVAFAPDPVALVWDVLVSDISNTRYYESNLLFFGSVRAQKSEILVVIGPTFSIRPGKEQVHTLLRVLGITHERIKEFEFYLNNLPTFPIESFLQVLCFINYIFNKQKLSIADFFSDETASQQPVQQNAYLKEPEESEPIHNTYRMERDMLSYITFGQTDALKVMLSSPPTGRVGQIAHDQLRQMKNTFICAATLASRAAIIGGLSHEIAFALSDSYIQKAELQHDYNAITRLNMTMLLDFCARVETQMWGSGYSMHVTDAMRYINKNINRKITMEQVVSAVGISRAHLSVVFAKEVGVTINVYITQRKVDEAKRLLSTTQMSLAAIGEYLDYSSQRYFHIVF